MLAIQLALLNRFFWGIGVWFWGTN